MDGVQPLEVHITTVQGNDGFFFQRNGIQDVEVVDGACCHADEDGDRTPDVQQCVDLDRPFGLAKCGPGKQGKAQIDRGGIQGIERMIQLDSQFFVVVELPGYADQMIPEILVDPPIPNLVRIGQGGSGYLSPESNVIELFVMGVQACLDIPQAFPVGELCESHAEELVVTGKPSDPVVSAISADAFVEFVTRQVL